MQDPEKIADFILSHLTLNVEQAQQLLEISDQKACLSTSITILVKKKLKWPKCKKKIRSNARDSMNQAQKEFYLREQLRAIKKELGEDDLEEKKLFA